jgi:LCP family protein required for cell wall assembly
MKTTLKRGVGRGHGFNGSGNGDAAVPPAPLSPVVLYRQPPPARAGGTRLALRILGWAGFVLAMCVAGVAGGSYLYLHESVAAVAPRTAGVRAAAKTLDVPLPGQPANALVIGYDKRADEADGTPSRSDTVMLVRADPGAKTISLLSFPRDLNVEIRCPDQGSYVAKLNAAYAACGEKGTLETVKALTGVPVNYLITVNFRGFRQLVDRLGGVWMDVDRRYFNDRGGPTGYAKINLQPGYQLLTGYKALDFVRYRHTDSDLFRNARQQQFVRGFKEQIESSFTPLTLPKVINVITKNVEVGQGGGKDVDARTVLSYALLAYSLPSGHVFQTRLDGIGGFADLSVSQENMRRAVDEFTHPDVEAPRKATAVALGEKVKTTVLRPGQTTVAVLNGNGVSGSASTANYLLSQRGYQAVLPPNGVPANAPTFDFFRSVVYYDPSATGALPAARKMAALFGSADVKRVPPEIKALSNGAMLVTVVGQTFHGRLAAAPTDQTPDRNKADVVSGASAAYDDVKALKERVPFPLMVPTTIERSSWIDRERPARLYWIDEDKKHKAVRLTYKLAGTNEYWGVQQTSWNDAPVLEGRNFTRTLGGRRYELFYNGPRLHMVVLRTNDASYWVVNTLLDKLSNETMIAIAKGLRPLAAVKR